ncbi:hypothetical protein ACQP2K_04460 [Microbispora siamensis]
MNAIPRTAAGRQSRSPARAGSCWPGARRRRAELDTELTDGLNPEETEALRRALGTLARRNGLPAD